MTAQAYIQSKLDQLRQPLGLTPPTDTDQLVEAILKAILSKKFRKYSASPELIEHVRNSIRLHVEKQEPINVTTFHGGYKLWRLEESPEVDWAELFTLMHYGNWVKPVCELYAPGVHFDFLVDDWIVPRLNNVPSQDIVDYLKSYQEMIDFLQRYLLPNLRMTITPVGSLYASEQTFWESVERNMDALRAELPGGLPTVNEKWRATIELNVRLSPEQQADPQWREKVLLVHDAYSRTKAEPGYYKNRPDKILAFTTPLPMAVAVGTTKDSIMKFWVGVGVLKPRGNDYRQIILSWQQLQKARFATEDVRFPGLTGKNFGKIRVLTD